MSGEHQESTSMLRNRKKSTEVGVLDEMATITKEVASKVEKYENVASKVEKCEKVAKKAEKFDNNDFATRKTVAKGFMNVALLSGNAGQLKACLQMGPDGQNFYILVFMLTMSIFFQALAGILMLYEGSININCDGSDGMTEGQRRGKRINDIATAVVFMITFLNVLIPAFGVKIPRDC